MTGSGAIRIVLADDHNLVRAGVRALLEGIRGVEIVAEASDGRQALAAIAEHRPDIAILDISMPGQNGLDAADRIRAESPKTRVVLLSMHANEAYVARALRIGVAGYVLKEACREELPVLVRAVMRGETYLSPGISKLVVDALRAKLSGDATASGADLLTPRQREILQLVAEGKSTKEVATLLDLGIKTVETHRAQIMERLDIHDLPGLVRFAIRTGIVSAEK